MVSKKSAEYILETYREFFEKMKNRVDHSSNGYYVIHNIFYALSAIKDELDYKPSIENISDNPQDALDELTKIRWRKSVFLFLADDEDTKDQCSDLLTDLLDPYLEVKAGGKPPSVTLPTVQNLKDPTAIGIEFINALQHFLQNPDITHREKLTRSAGEIYLMEIQQHGLDADQYTTLINEFLAPLLKDININAQQNASLANLVRDLGQSDREKDITAFHVLNHAHLGYLQPKMQVAPPVSYFNRHPLLKNTLIGIVATVTTMSVAFPALGVALAFAGGVIAGILGIGVSIIAGLTLFSAVAERLFQTPSDPVRKRSSPGPDLNYPNINYSLCVLSHDTQGKLTKDENPENPSEKNKIEKADAVVGNNIKSTLYEADKDNRANQKFFSSSDKPSSSVVVADSKISL